MSSFVKLVDAACKPKPDLPNPKAIDAILERSHIEDGPLGLCQALSSKLSSLDRNVVYKGLIALHVMIQRGSTNHVLSSISAEMEVLPFEELIDRWQYEASPVSPTHSWKPTSSYALYLKERIRAYVLLQQDVISAEGSTDSSHRMSMGWDTPQEEHRSLLGRNNTRTNWNDYAENYIVNRESEAITKLEDFSIEGGLLKSVAVSLRQARMLLDSLKRFAKVGSELAVMAWRMLLKDLVTLFQACRKGIASVARHHPHMSDVDATTGTQLHREFCLLAEQVENYFKFARQLQSSPLLGIFVPPPLTIPELVYAKTGDVFPVDTIDEDAEENKRAAETARHGISLYAPPLSVWTQSLPEHHVPGPLLNNDLNSNVEQPSPVLNSPHVHKLPSITEGDFLSMVSLSETAKRRRRRNTKSQDLPRMEEEEENTSPTSSESDDDLARPSKGAIAVELSQQLSYRAATPQTSDPPIVEKDPKFLNIDVCLQLDDLGLLDAKEFHVFASQNTISLTSSSQTVVYNVSSHKLRQLQHSKPQSDLTVSYGSILSPDGNLMIRHLDGVTEAINIGQQATVGILPQHFGISCQDFLCSNWVGSSTLLIPSLKRGVIVQWDLSDNRIGAFTRRFQPLSVIMRHQVLEFHSSPDSRWWTAVGRSLDRDGWHGKIEVYDTEMEESRVVNGTACCHAEIEVYDKKTPLLVVVDTREGNNLSLSISQLGISSDGPRFIPVNVCLQFDAATDSAIRVTLLDKLPIVVVATQKKSLYFFELHSGTHLYTHHDLDFMLSTSVDGQSILNQLAYRTLERISINEKDLIRWVRKVLNNHALASSISIRTGLPDTDVVTTDNMRTLR